MIRLTFTFRFILDMGVPQTFDIMDDEVDYEEMLEDYLGGAAHLAAVAKNPELRHVLPYCKNKHALCTYWATRGDCDTNKYQMDMECCPVCESASQLDWNMECPFSKDQEHAWRPGDLNQFFVNLTTLPEYQRYQPTIHSQPSDNGGPWVVTLENVINEKEAAVLIQHGVEHGWEESFTESDPTADGTTESEVSDYRTSTLAWCMEKSCLNDTIVAGVLDRLSNITNLPQYHSDWLQLLRYRKGNYYKEHHDLLHHQIYSMGGHRILTFYIYLSDVEEGGGTNFPYVNNLTITPKLGRALLWPNVLNEDPDAMDDRMYHQALPVVKGEKYGATACKQMSLMCIACIVLPCQEKR